jgi:hypothetical protein
MADEDEAPGDVGTTPMPVLSADGWPVYPSVVERYFTTHTTSNHQALHIHSNGLCLLALAPSHPLLAAGGPRITSVCFREHDAKNLLSNEVRGKKKSGAVFMGPRDMVAKVHSDDGADPVTLYACVRANVIEINKALVESPELLRAPGTRGWLAVLMPKMGEKQGIGAALLEYDRAQPLQHESTSLKRRIDDELPVSKKSRKAGKAAAKPCWDFTDRGYCKFGERCRFVHSSLTEDGEGGGQGRQGGEQRGEAAGLGEEGAGPAADGEAAGPAPDGDGAECGLGVEAIETASEGARQEKEGAGLAAGEEGAADEESPPKDGGGDR